MPSSLHWHRIDGSRWSRSTSDLRSGTLIFRTSVLKIPLHRQLADLGMELLDLALVTARAFTAPALKGSRRLVEQLLLPRVNLVRVDLVALRQIGHRRLLPQRLQGDLRLQRRV